MVKRRQIDIGFTPFAATLSEREGGRDEKWNWIRYRCALLTLLVDALSYRHHTIVVTPTIESIVHASTIMVNTGVHFVRRWCAHSYRRADVFSRVPDLSRVRVMYHQAFYPQAQGFSNQHGPNHANFMPSHSYYYPPGPIPTHSSHNLNFTRDFDRHPTANPAFTSMPSGAHPFYDATNQHFDQQRWRPYTAKGHQQQRFHQMPAFHFQDKSTFYYMSDPMYTADDRITVSRQSIWLFSSKRVSSRQIQLTKVHIGPNGDQQRVFVEQEFSNERELGKFVRNLRFNFEKTFNNRATGTHGSTDNIGENAEFNGKKSGYETICVFMRLMIMMCFLAASLWLRNRMKNRRSILSKTILNQLPHHWENRFNSTNRDRMLVHQWSHPLQLFALIGVEKIRPNTVDSTKMLHRNQLLTENSSIRNRASFMHRAIRVTTNRHLRRSRRFHHGFNNDSTWKKMIFVWELISVCHRTWVSIGWVKRIECTFWVCLCWLLAV